MMGVKRSSEEVEALKKRIVDLIASIKGGTFEGAIEAAGVGHGEAYSWKKEDPEFSDAIDRARRIANDRGGDLAESKLMKKIEEEDTTCIIFYLKTRHKSRGYVEKVITENTHKGDTRKPVTVRYINDWRTNRGIGDRGSRPALPAPGPAEGAPGDEKVCISLRRPEVEEDHPRNGDGGRNGSV